MKTIVEKATEYDFKHLELVDFCDIPEPGPKKWVWFEQVPEKEVTLLFGLPGTGKSALALCLGMHVACGLPAFLGQNIGTGSNVLCIDAEMDRDIFKHRGELVKNKLDKVVPNGSLLYCRVNDYLLGTKCGEEGLCPLGCWN